MGYRLYDSIRQPVQWQNEKTKRYAAIKKELLAVRDAQVVFKGENSRYAKNFIELRYFLAKGKIKKYYKNAGFKKNDELPFTYINPADSIFGKGYNVYNLGFVPFNKARQTFTLNIVKNNKTFDIVGCTPQYLKEYLENKFTEGMSWVNHSQYGWHIDHIIPLSSAKTEDELYKLCHYTNLQPLWAEDNLKKSNKIL